MAPTVSLISAPPHFNPGMYSVDLAFDRMMARSGLHANVQRYCYGGPHTATGLAEHSLVYRSLEDHFDAVLDADLILYWGDFHHAYAYWWNALHNGPNRGRPFAGAEAETAHVARHLLMAGQPIEVLGRVMSFGTSLLGDDLRSLATIDSGYREALPHFARHARRLWFRDPISAARVATMRGDPHQSLLGVDCAHLLTADDYRAIAGPSMARTDDYACVFFGRVDASMEATARLTRRLLGSASLDAVWIPWLGPGSPVIETFSGAIPEMAVAAAPVTYEQLIDRVARARLVVTDAYHLCLIAWRLGVPAVCVGLGAQRAVRPISDKKKEVFHLAQGISPLYVFHETIAEPMGHPELVRDLLALVLDPTYVAAVADALTVQSDAAEADLSAAIGAALA